MPLRCHPCQHPSLARRPQGHQLLHLLQTVQAAGPVGRGQNAGRLRRDPREELPAHRRDLPQLVAGVRHAHEPEKRIRLVTGGIGQPGPGGGVIIAPFPARIRHVLVQPEHEILRRIDAVGVERNPVNAAAGQRDRAGKAELRPGVGGRGEPGRVQRGRGRQHRAGNPGRVRVQPGGDRAGRAAHIPQHKGRCFQCAVRSGREGLGGVERRRAVPKGKSPWPGAGVGVEPFRMRVMPPGQGPEPARTDQAHFRRAGLAAPAQGGGRPGVLRQPGVPQAFGEDLVNILPLQDPFPDPVFPFRLGITGNGRGSRLAGQVIP